jgi:hypothetical protein
MYSGRVYQLKADEFLTIIGSDFTLLKVDNLILKILKALIDSYSIFVLFFSPKKRILSRAVHLSPLFNIKTNSEFSFFGQNFGRV